MAGTEMEHAMLSLVAEYPKLVLLFLLIGTVVALSWIGNRKRSSPFP
jgi:hypothetical protein